MEKQTSFEGILHSHPDSRIVYDLNGVIKTVSYKELQRKVDNFPIPSSQSVGILARGGLDDLIAIFALAKAKKQITMLDPGEEEGALARQIETANVDCVVGEAASDTPAKARISEGKPRTKQDGILFFTSGTTSSNKPVELSEESLCASAYNGASLLPLSTDDTLLSILPWNHVYGFVGSVLWGLQCGATLAIGRGARHMMDDLFHFHPTTVSLVPQMAAFYLSRNLLNPELRMVLIGAGLCPNEVLNGIKAKGIKVSYGYGLTETSSGVALSLGGDPNEMSICPEVKIKIAGDGEIMICAPTVFMRGYYGDEKKTAESFNNEGYLKTGDLGYLKDGKLHLSGRKKEIVVFDDGTKVFLPEYEDSLAKAIGTHDLAAVFSPKEGMVLVIEKPIDELKERLNVFNAPQRRSAKIRRVIVLNKKLPRTKTGKIKRYEIKID